MVVSCFILQFVVGACPACWEHWSWGWGGAEQLQVGELRLLGQ